jgi:hypothetical protein
MVSPQPACCAPRRDTPSLPGKQIIPDRDRSADRSFSCTAVPDSWSRIPRSSRRASPGLRVPAERGYHVLDWPGTYPARMLHVSKASLYAHSPRDGARSTHAQRWRVGAEEAQDREFPAGPVDASEIDTQGDEGGDVRRAPAACRANAHGSYLRCGAQDQFDRPCTYRSTTACEWH